MMTRQKIEYAVEASGTVPEAVEALTRSLKAREFGVIGNIDVSKIVKEKTGEDIDSYVILEVCNVKDAKCALGAHKEAGLALPCKIAVYKNGDKVLASLYKPTEALKALGFSDLEPLAEEVEAQLMEAVDAVAARRTN